MSPFSKHEQVAVRQPKRSWDPECGIILRARDEDIGAADQVRVQRIFVSITSRSNQTETPEEPPISQIEH